MIDPALRFDNGYNWYSFTAFLKPYLNENNITPTQLAITAAVAIGADNEKEAKGLAGNLATAPKAFRAKVAKQLADLYHRDAKSQAAWAEYQSSRSKKNRSNPHSRSNGMTAFRMNGRHNPFSMPPNDYTLMMQDDHDENYEIAMSEDGIMGYKIIGRINNPDAKLPDGYYPGSAMVVVAFDGNVYSVRLVDAEDVQQRTLANRIPTAKDAELRAKDELVKMNASASGSGRPKRKI